MTTSHSFAIAGLAFLALASCTADDLRPVVQAIGNAPMVCPSAVELDDSVGPQFVKFRPFVENRGVNDNTKTFTVSMHIVGTLAGQVIEDRILMYTGNGVGVIKGTGGVPGVTAGPRVELTSTTNSPSRNVPYNPEATYAVTLDFKSSEDVLTDISASCAHLGPVNFKGGQPI